MSVCKIVLQCSCGSGENCRFEHQTNIETDHNNDSTISTPYQPSTDNTDINTLTKSITNDMIKAGKSNQWLLSTYAPFKEKCPFPGFEDQSYEEIRFDYNEALKSGTVEQFKQNFQIALEFAALKMKALINPSKDLLELIKSLYGNSKQEMLQSNNIDFGNLSSGLFGESLFSQKQQQNPATSSIFAKINQTLFGGNQKNNVPTLFGGGNSDSTPESKFGDNQQLKGFEENTSNFNQQQPQTQTLFGEQKTNFTTQQNSKPSTNKTTTNPFIDEYPSPSFNSKQSSTENVQQQNNSIAYQQQQWQLQQQRQLQEQHEQWQIQQLHEQWQIRQQQEQWYLHHKQHLQQQRQLLQQQQWKLQQQQQEWQLQQKQQQRELEQQQHQWQLQQQQQRHLQQKQQQRESYWLQLHEYQQALYSPANSSSAFGTSGKTIAGSNLFNAAENQVQWPVDLVLKVRISGSSDQDFIEVEVPHWKQTYSNLMKICCRELGIIEREVERIRKLPNTRLRKDNDVKRLHNFQSIEIDLKAPLNSLDK